VAPLSLTIAARKGSYQVPETNKAMHAGKIRSANLPIFQLDPKNAVVLIGLIGALAYIVGFVVGLGY
jgi:hypothetical protein